MRGTDPIPVSPLQARALLDVPIGAGRIDVRTAIRAAATTFGETDDASVFDAAARRIDVVCRETYGPRLVETQFHVDGDWVVAVHRDCGTRPSCDLQLWLGCPP